MDADDNGMLDISDPVFLAGYLLDGGSPPRPPYPEAGQDISWDSLSCLSYNPAPPPKLADFALGFQTPVAGPAAGEDQPAFQVFVSLTTSNNSVDHGAEGWSLTIGCENVTILSLTTEGTAGADRGCPASCFLARNEVAGNPQGSSAFSAALLYDNSYACLPLSREGTDRLLGLTVRLEDASKPGRLFFSDGTVVLNGTAQTPVLGEVAISLPSGGLVIPGDSNDDGGLDLSDAVTALGFLFLGSPKSLPCGDGTSSDPGNISLLDWQPDGKIDISDAIATLTFLFVGGSPHALAVPGSETRSCVPISGCLDSCRS
jgi:hypothetical protein